jgi:hypothetical protein
VDLLWNTRNSLNENICRIWLSQQVLRMERIVLKRKINKLGKFKHGYCKMTIAESLILIAFFAEEH